MTLRRVLAAGTIIVAATACTMPAARALAPRASAPWSLGATPDPGPGPELHGVSCSSEIFCVAVGTNASGSQQSGTLVEQWDGAAWSTVPSDEAGIANVLDAVSCVGDSWCVAVGSTRSGGTTRPLVETFDGSVWSTFPVLSASVSGALAGVSCVTPTSCMAVGSQSVGHGFAPAIALHWDGHSWTRLALARRGTRSNVLDAVSCASAAQCVAVGSWASPSTRRPLVERWDGASWSALRDAYRDAVDDALTSVSCPTTAQCVAVGNGRSGFIQVLANATVQTNAIGLPGGPVALTGISCPALGACTVVGFTNAPSTPGAPAFAASWDGTAWTPVVLSSASERDELLTVSCAGSAGSAGSASCVAAGRRGDSNGAHSTLVESDVPTMQTTAVTVTLTRAEQDRLAAVASEFGQTPQAFLNNSVYGVAYLVTVLPSTPTPVVLPPAGEDARYVVVFDTQSAAALQSVEHHFALAAPDAVRFAMELTAYLVIAGGG